MSYKKNIAIIAGGYSSEIIISLKSAQGIRSFIDSDKYNLAIVLITEKQWLCYPGSLMDKVDDVSVGIEVDKNDFSVQFADEKIKFDFAYITIHGTPGENGLLQGYFDMLNIPYSCCGVLASSLTFSKYFCNKFLQSFGVKTASSVCLRKNQSIDDRTIVETLGLPVFVKPNDGGSSFATTKVSLESELQDAIRLAFEEGSEVIIESFMPGTEVTCGCYQVGEKLTVFPITEVVSKNEFFNFDAKYNPQSVEEITPARISDELTAEIKTLTGNIYHWIGARGIIRVDYIISPEGEVRMLEVNTTPGMTTTSFIPQQIKAAGLNISEVMTEIIENESN
ncbi:D-alanine--D-alanine ligase [Bacteroidales bacterium OttesenSCG-928-M11]|nr:D-alanine--D-alanine ligase [Bacteroidales bacterium OttesenSCG-928-M11]